MLVLIVDNNQARYERLKAAISRLCPEARYCYARTPAWDNPALLEESACLCLYHWNNKIFMDDPIIRKAVCEAKHKIAYGSEGIGVSVRLAEGWLRISGQVSDEEGFPSATEWVEFLSWLKDGAERSEHLPQMLSPHFKPFATAMLVMCQGCIAVLKGNIEGDQQALSAEVRSPKWWRAALGEWSDDLLRAIRDEIPLAVDVDKDVEELVSWFSGTNNDPLSRDELLSLVEAAEEYLSGKLAARSVKA